MRSGHAPWITMMMIDLPPSLPLGPARIELDTLAVYPGTNSHISNLSTVTQSLVGNGTIDPPIALEILPGTGTAADFPLELGYGAMITGNLTQLEPQSHVQISPPFVEGNPLAWPKYGAVELTLTIDTNSPLSSATYRLVPDDMSFSTDSHYSLLSNLEGDQLTVVFVSPEGMLQYFEPRFSVVLDSGVQFSPVTDPVTLSSVRYYDPRLLEQLLQLRLDELLARARGEIQGRLLDRLVALHRLLERVGGEHHGRDRDRVLECRASDLDGIDDAQLEHVPVRVTQGVVALAGRQAPRIRYGWPTKGPP